MGILKGKKALITGGGAGIGAGIAKIFAKEGAEIAIFGRSQNFADGIRTEIESVMDEKREIFYKSVDVSKTKDVEIAVEEVVKKFGNIDILVNNAGITKDGLLLKMSESDWDDVLDVNLKSLFNTCKIAIKSMLKQKSGKIINITSVVGIIGNSGQTNYSASKAGMIGFSKSLAKELARRNINVNCIAPGYIITKMTEELPEEVKEKILEKIPMQRFGEPLDIAKTALFFATADYITGQVIAVDGGMIC